MSSRPFRLEWSHAALAHVESISESLANASSSGRVVEPLFDRVGSIADNPWRGARLLGADSNGLRKLNFGKYRVVYVIDDASKRVSIVAVHHLAQAPSRKEAAATRDL